MSKYVKLSGHKTFCHVIISAAVFREAMGNEHQRSEKAKQGFMNTIMKYSLMILC